MNNMKRTRKDELWQIISQKQSHISQGVRMNFVQYSTDMGNSNNKISPAPIYYILTNPAALVYRNSEVLFPQSFCKFEFASTVNLLKTTLTLTRYDLLYYVTGWSPDPETPEKKHEKALEGKTSLKITQKFKFRPENIYFSISLFCIYFYSGKISSKYFDMFWVTKVTNIFFTCNGWFLNK